MSVNKVSKAAEMARIYHAGQLYNERDYYTNHVACVGHNVEKHLYYSDINDKEVYCVVAYLHDIVEDTSCTLDSIEREFCITVRDAVDAITKRNNEKYIDYLDRVVENKYARLVKYFDVLHNLDTTVHCLREADTEKNRKRYIKYTQVLSMIYPIN